LNVTDALGLRNLTGDSVVITVGDVAVTGLSASNSSLTRLTDTTFFTAMINAGSNIIYQWSFGDGQTASGATTSHTYAMAGNYTALVTATNSVGRVSASTLVTITNQRPLANAGSDQGAIVNALLTLDGSGSTDPDGHLPLTYGWMQTGGPSVSFTPNVSVTIFTAPSTPAVLTFTLNVTDAQGLPNLLGDTVVITVGDSTIAGLVASNSSPTRLTDVTYFTATLATGSNVTYQWNFGDGQTSSDANTSHTYAAMGTYTALITATNSVSSVSVSTSVTVTNQAPIANAGIDQSVLVNAIVILDASASSDPDGHLPLTYGWTQSGGPASVLSSAVISRPTFTAPSAPAVLTFTLVVTDACGAGSAPAVVTVLVDDHAITNLQASNNGPTRIGNSTSFTATINAGSNALYTWDFGDGQTAAGAQVSHRYANIGFYTATVAATNGAGSISATTPVSIERAPLYLPLIANQSVAAPDLVVADLTATSNGIQVVIKNQGTAPVLNEFWVDVYVAPAAAPTHVNQTWAMLGEQGLVWGVTAEALPTLVPGGVMTLTLNDAYYQADLGHVAWPVPAGTALYAQVDSANATTSYGAVLETHEILNWPYNNILGPVLSMASETVESPPNPMVAIPRENSRLPERP
jgi:PKD repeat protein